MQFVGIVLSGVCVRPSRDRYPWALGGKLNAIPGLRGEMDQKPNVP